MSTTKRKQNQIKKSTKSASKKPSQSSRTKISSSKQTLITAKEKKDSLHSDIRKKKDASLLSSAKLKTNGEKSQELSLHDTLKNLKKRSIKEQKQGENGFVKPTEEEKIVLKKTKFGDAMGRPKKEEDEKLQVESIRFSFIEKTQLIHAAKKEGFLNWKKFVKYVALEKAKKSA